MSRLGQCFTQSRQLGVKIDRESYSEIFDYFGGQNSSGEPYNFSDGVGMISPRYCYKIVRELGLGNCLPSCIQIRFRGYKGIVTLNPVMEEVRQWTIRNNRLPRHQTGVSDPWYSQSLLFRESQHKFYGPREKYIEVVKFSKPICINLNKPLINILDQVSRFPHF